MPGKSQSFGKFIQRATLFSLAFAVFGLAFHTKLAAYSPSPLTSPSSSVKLSIENRNARILKTLDARDQAAPDRTSTLSAFTHFIHVFSAIQRSPYSVSQQAEITVSHAGQSGSHPVSTLRRPPPSLV